MKTIANRFLVVILITSILGCHSDQPKEHRLLIGAISTAKNKLAIGEEEEIKLANFYNNYLKVITPPYVSKDEFMAVINNVELSKKLAWITASKESCHLFVFDNNHLLADIVLPGYVDVSARILFSRNKDIILKVKKIERAYRPLIIENLQ